MSLVVIIAGGTSSERAVSLRSGAAVQQALIAAGHDVQVLDPATESVSSLVGPNIVAFPVVHGAGGEDGTLQSELETAGIPFVGSGSQSSRICFDKATYRDLLLERGFPVARGELVSAAEFGQHGLSQLPYVLKPNNGGSSIDTVIARRPEDVLDYTIDALFGRYESMLLEELIEGIEVTVAVLGNQALPVIEIVPPEGQEFDYEHKYDGSTQELCPAEHLSSAQQTEAQQLALAIHEACGCADYSRTDMIMRSDGSFVILETNTLPGMTDQSLFPKSARVIGIDMPELCDTLVGLALNRQIANA